MGKTKVTNKQIIDTLENYPDKTLTEISKLLGVTLSTLSQRMSRIKETIRDAAEEYIAKHALSFAYDLKKQSESGKTEATKAALEIANLYARRTQTDIDITVTQQIQAITEEAELLAEKTISQHIFQGRTLPRRKKRPLLESRLPKPEEVT